MTHAGCEAAFGFGVTAPNDIYDNNNGTPSVNTEE